MTIGTTIPERVGDGDTALAATVSDLADEVVRRTRVESPTSRRTWLTDWLEITALAAERAGDERLAQVARRFLR